MVFSLSAKLHKQQNKIEDNNVRDVSRQVRIPGMDKEVNGSLLESAYVAHDKKFAALKECSRLSGRASKKVARTANSFDEALKECSRLSGRAST